MDFKEYSKQRSIARKRIERLSAAGKMDYVKIPTVAEIRKSAHPEMYMQQVQSFLAQPYTTVKAARKANVTKLAPVKFTDKPEPKKKTRRTTPAAQKAPQLTPDEKLARRREQKRRSKAKRAVEKAAKDPAQAKRYAAFLKAFEKVGKDLRKLGVDLGQWMGVLSPKNAIAFAEYMEYRFSQGDFKEQYVIDIFIKDFATMQKQGHSMADLRKDFDAFLADRAVHEQNAEHTNQYGYTTSEVMGLWKEYVKG